VPQCRGCRTTPSINIQPPSAGVPLKPETLPPSIDTAAMSAMNNSPEMKAFQEGLKKNPPKIGNVQGPMKGMPGGNAASDMAGPKASTNANGCPVLTRTLTRGSRGSDVTPLQTYLISQSLLAKGSATGYFGAMTEVAVKSGRPHTA
jgi:hypothetical protein